MRLHFSHGNDDNADLYLPYKSLPKSFLGTVTSHKETKYLPGPPQTEVGKLEDGWLELGEFRVICSHQAWLLLERSREPKADKNAVAASL